MFIQDVAQVDGEHFALTQARANINDFVSRNVLMSVSKFGTKVAGLMCRAYPLQFSVLIVLWLYDQSLPRTPAQENKHLSIDILLLWTTHLQVKSQIAATTYVPYNHILLSKSIVGFVR